MPIELLVWPHEVEPWFYSWYTEVGQDGIIIRHGHIDYCIPALFELLVQRVL